ncbi:hypothetical protein ATE84_2295 [Aquimarina sp. MAR_2010_214]|uniref:hypothetical protein n=1 Tax=Aquimarina sp. MAR_2010_214 TaxID=1250026 RepID=UPI000C711697|nr:hypothetical protein [Aquimarina sp. MAR_2010_214]PKV50240.1 hypothetical protein ATE84_2295 [Aquimarina sp. MAR_2010_214]
MKHIKRLAIELWLKENQDFINGVGLDKRIGFPSGTIQKFLKYERKLNDKRITAIDHFLNKVSIEQYKKQIRQNVNEE